MSPDAILGGPACESFKLSWAGVSPVAADGKDHHLAAANRFLCHMTDKHGMTELVRGHLPVMARLPLTYFGVQKINTKSEEKGLLAIPREVYEVTAQLLNALDPG